MEWISFDVFDPTGLITELISPMAFVKFVQTNIGKIWNGFFRSKIMTICHSTNSIKNKKKPQVH